MNNAKTRTPLTRNFKTNLPRRQQCTGVTASAQTAVFEKMWATTTAEKTGREPWSVCERKKAKTRKPTIVPRRTFVLGKVWEETEYRFEVGYATCGGQKNSVRDALSACACIRLSYCQHLTDFDVFKRSSMSITQKTPRSHYKYQ